LQNQSSIGHSGGSDAGQWSGLSPQTLDRTVIAVFKLDLGSPPPQPQFTRAFSIGKKILKINIFVKIALHWGTQPSSSHLQCHQMI
jgi:hypothetical protein